MKMHEFEAQKFTETEINLWPIANSGLSARVANCLNQIGVKTIGELREMKPNDLLALNNFGVTSLDNVRWFFNWTARLNRPNGHLSSFKTLLREFLNSQEIFVIEQRYGLTDPLFRPHMKRKTLQQVADMRARVTRERVRQVEESALIALQSRLCRAVAAAQEAYWVNRIQDRSCVVTAAEMSDWAGDPMLGGYQPWGVLLLLSEIQEHITFRYDYFTSLSAPVLTNVEKQILQILHMANEPVPFEKILAKVSDDLSFLNGQRPRLVTILLDHHPEISGTTDRRYFLPAVTSSVVIADIMRNRQEPIHFHELTQMYNQRMLPHSRKGTGYILRVLTLMPNAQRVTRAVYRLKTAKSA